MTAQTNCLSERELEQLAALDPADLSPADRAELAAILAAQHRLTEPLLEFVPRISPHLLAPRHLAPLAAALERTLTESVDLCVSVPPQHGKTELILHAIAQGLALRPADTVGYVSYAAEQAYSKSRLARDYAQAAGVTLRADSNATHEWRTVQGGGLLATGIGGPLTGQGVRRLIVDDPFKSRDDADSPLMRQRACDWLTSTGTTRVPEDGSRIIVQTRWHDDDLIGRMESGKYGPWEVINIPMLADDRGQPSDEGTRVLWPRQQLPDGRWVGWTLPGVHKRRVALGPYDWWSLCQGKPRPKGGAIFGKDNVEPARYDAGPDGKPSLEGARVVLAVDPAGTEDTAADHTVAVAVAMRGYGDDQVGDLLDVLRVQLEPQQSAPFLLAFQQKWGNGALLIEASRDGKALKKALQKIEPRLRIRLIPPIGDKFTRAQPLAAAWNKGRFRLPRAAEWLLDLLTEFSKFTGLGDAHDDQVDACAHAWNHAGAGHASSSDDTLGDGY